MLRVADDYFADSDTGAVRRANEDSFFARAPTFAVADGMGGAQAGEVASRTAIEVLAHARLDGPGMEDTLGAVVQEANARVHELARSDEALSGMGTTMTVVHVGGDELTLAHVGDSRAYRWRGGRLERLTDDHSLVDEYVRQGRITREEAEHHPQRSIITRAIGPEGRVEVDACTIAGRPGDVYLLCSDGLTTMLGEREITAVLERAPSLRAAGRELIALANEAGGRDNITVIVFRLEAVGADGDRGEQATTEAGVVRPDDQATRAAATVTRPRPTASPVVAAPAVASVPAPAPGATAPREPRPPRAAERGRRSPVGLLVGLVIAVTLLVSAYFATQTVYFVGATPDGAVAVYRGVPYDLPAGLDLYSRVYTSGVPAREYAAAVASHKLRSRDDAYRLVRAMERGEVERS